MQNNPINFNDPSGHELCDADGDCNAGKVINNRREKGMGGASKPNLMEASEQGEDLIKYYEGHNVGDNSYPDLYPYEDEGGTCTIGWGHVLPNENGCRGWPRKTYGNGITTDLAQWWFDRDIKTFEKLINDTITVDLTRAQFDALVSYTFNTGDQTNNPYFVKGIPDLMNSGNFEAAAEAIRAGPNTTGDPPTFVDKLVERRNVEANLFLFSIYSP